jgi:hypothetical protein
MRNGTQLRWMAVAEARQVREFALIQRGTSEPYVSIILGDPCPAWLEWFCELSSIAPRPPGIGPHMARPPWALGQSCKD